MSDAFQNGAFQGDAFQIGAPSSTPPPLAPEFGWFKPFPEFLRKSGVAVAIMATMQPAYVEMPPETPPATPEFGWYRQFDDIPRRNGSKAALDDGYSIGFRTDALSFGWFKGFEVPRRNKSTVALNDGYRTGYPASTAPFGWFGEFDAPRQTKGNSAFLGSVVSPPYGWQEVAQELQFGWNVSHDTVLPVRRNTIFDSPIWTPQEPVTETVTPDELGHGGWLPAEYDDKARDEWRKKRKKAEDDLDKAVRAAFNAAHGIVPQEELPDLGVDPSPDMAREIASAIAAKARDSERDLTELRKRLATLRSKAKRLDELMAMAVAMEQEEEAIVMLLVA